MNDQLCDRLVPVSLTPAEMTECGLPSGHEGNCAPKPKRQVSYNQDAVLCPLCKKRIRLNNNGRLRIHKSAKMGSPNCPGSDKKPVTSQVSLQIFSDQS